MNKGTKKVVTNCECCSNYVYDEDYEYYICEVNLDEDEMIATENLDVMISVEDYLI